MSADIITEILQQPRTGSQYTSKGSISDNLGDRSGTSAHQDDKKYGWQDDKKHAARLTLGYSNTLKNSSDCTSQGKWAWRPIGGTSYWNCIDPVKELCAINTWDGYDYQYQHWPKTPLTDTVKDASFANPCINNKKDKTHGGTESTTKVDTCDLTCSYDTSKFDTLEAVQAWEQKYGKYKRDLGGTTRDSRRTSSGKISNLTSIKDPFTDNYRKIMQHFCSRKSNNCPVDPKTGENAPKCSNLKSVGPAGDACRYWMDSYGPMKWSQMDVIGKEYCTIQNNQDSFDCSCVSRTDDPFFQDINAAVSSFEPNPGCFYLPCADPTTYIVGTDVMNLTPDPLAVESNYGMKCLNDLCINLVNLDQNAYNEMNKNQLYINCGSGFPPGSGYFARMQTTNPLLFWLIIACIICFILCLLSGTIYHFSGTRKDYVRM